jgi:hypothetical protein
MIANSYVIDFFVIVFIAIILLWWLIISSIKELREIKLKKQKRETIILPYKPSRSQIHYNELILYLPHDLVRIIMHYSFVYNEKCLLKNKQQYNLNKFFNK